MKNELMTATSALALLVFAPPHAAQAGSTLVATIYGVYDAEAGIGDLPSGAITGLTQVGSNGVYDTPSLFFVNPTGYTISNPQMQLLVTTAVNNGQNTYNNGVTQTISTGAFIPGSVTQVSWGSSGSFNGGYGVSPNLFVDDYDDEYNQNYGAGVAGNAGSKVDCTLTYPNDPNGWFNYCAPIGNFEVKFSGTLTGGGPLSGKSVAAVFGEFNTSSVYTGWEGIDPNGWSENATYDVHSGTVSGVLANIYLGTTGTVQSSPLTGVPEPTTAAVLGAGLGALGLVRWRRKPQG
jgi:hypothetical protein